MVELVYHDRSVKRVRWECCVCVCACVRALVFVNIQSAKSAGDVNSSLENRGCIMFINILKVIFVTALQ